MLIYFITKRQKAQSKVYPVENAVEVKDYAKENRFLTLKHRRMGFAWANSSEKKENSLEHFRYIKI